MAVKRELTCICCPLGCSVCVEEHDGVILDIKGYTCPKGKQYAEDEVTAPRRMVTTTVRVHGGVLPIVSVKTKDAIPKEKISQCIEELKDIALQAPVSIGDIAVSNAADTGVPVIVTKNVRILNENI